MALPDISFSPVYDIHLLRGLSIDLLALLRIGNQTAADFRTANPTVIYAFTPFIKKTSGTGNQHTGSNISVDTKTGAVSTQVAIPAPEKRNFLVKAEAKLGNETHETYIRIHIHHVMSDAWLTPSILTVPQGIDGHRFSVRIKFDDDVVAEIGDISAGFPPLTNTNLFTITWSHPRAGFIDPATGSISPGTATTNDVQDPVEATVTVPSLGVSITAKGHVRIDDQLSGNATNVAAELVSSGNCPGIARANDVPNILFIPDGFLAEDKPYFDHFVDEYVSKLTTGKITAPFDILSGSINFWKVFVSSRERGVTTRSEVYLRQRNVGLVGVPFMNPVKQIRADGSESTDASKWVYYHLFYHVGLPVKLDQQRDNVFIRNDWKQNTLLSSAQVDDITDFNIDQWKNTTERRLPEERDTALGLMINDYTAARNDSDFQKIVFNQPKRMSRGNLNRFFANLKEAQSGNNIGKHFVQGLFTPRLIGKDQANIVFVTATSRARENNTGSGFFIAIREWPGYYFMESGSLTKTKVGVQIDTHIQELALSKMAALTHELAHSFALEDEYGETSPDLFANKFITDPLVSSWQYTRSPDSASSLDWAGNVQTRKDMLSQNPLTPTIGMLDANKLKWRHHRIEKCAIVASDITSAGNLHTVTLRQGHAKQFSIGERVFLRRRIECHYVLGGVIGTPNAVPRQVVQRISPDAIEFEAATISAINVALNQITIRDVNNNSFIITFSVSGAAALFTVNDAVEAAKFIDHQPIQSINRISPLFSPTGFIESDLIIPMLSQELEVKTVNDSTNTVVVTPTDGNPLSADLLKLATGQVMILYKPMDAPASVLSATNKYAEVISKQVLDRLIESPFAFNAKLDTAHSEITEVIDNRAEQQSSIPDSLVPSCSSQKKRIVGVYSGGNQYHGDIYHATGKCFMRNEFHNGSFDEFCAVCKYVMIDMIDPTKHGRLNDAYSRKIYPGIPLDLTFLGGLPEL